MAQNVSIQVFGITITNEWLALAIFLVAAFTDLLDGYLARRWGPGDHHPARCSIPLPISCLISAR